MAVMLLEGEAAAAVEVGTGATVQQARHRTAQAAPERTIHFYWKE